MDDTCTKLAIANGILPKLRYFVPIKTFVSVYFSWLYPHVFMVVWFDLTQPNVTKIESSNYRNVAFGLLFTQNSLSILVLFFLN